MKHPVTILTLEHNNASYWRPVIGNPWISGIGNIFETFPPGHNISRTTIKSFACWRNGDLWVPIYLGTVRWVNLSFVLLLARNYWHIQVRSSICYVKTTIARANFSLVKKWRNHIFTAQEELLEWNMQAHSPRSSHTKFTECWIHHKKIYWEEPKYIRVTDASPTRPFLLHCQLLTLSRAWHLCRN